MKKQFLLIFSLFIYVASYSQQKYPVAEEILPLLDKIPALDLTIQKASKVSSCGEVCCTENAISAILKKFDKIAQERLKAPEIKEDKKLGLNNINLNDAASNLDLKTGATALAKSTVKVLDSNPALLSGKTVKVLDSNPAMLGNKSVKVLDTNPAMLSNTKTTKALDSNPAMLSTPTNSGNQNTTQNTTVNNYPTLDNEVNKEVNRLLKDEAQFRASINSQWEQLQKDFNTEIEKMQIEKKSIETDASLDEGAKNKQLKAINKRIEEHYANFMKNKANSLLTSHKQEIVNRYTYLDITIKQNNYGINDTSLYASINDAQDTMLELIEALAVYAADCITVGCVLNKEVK